VISHEHKCIFIAQRKCAGSSIIHAFGLRWTSASTLPPEWHYMNHGTLTCEFHSKPADYYVFSVVRNPWDRLVSGWKFCPETRDWPLRELLRHLPREGYAYQHVTRLQETILRDQEGRLVTNRIARFENLQADFDLVCGEIGKPLRPLPRLNPCPVERLHYREHFAGAVDRDLFLHHFARDVDFFEYEF